MTIAELAELHHRRNAALKAMLARSPHDTLETMSPEDRARVDAASREFRRCDAEIVTELRRRPGPVRVGDVELRLTADKLNYAECDPRTGVPIYCDKASRGLLYDYANGGAKGRRTVPA